jgi:hypothetical protein
VPGIAYADSHAVTTPPEESPLTMTGRAIARAMNLTMSLPKLSTV